MSTTYTTQIRVLLCQRCGAPLQSAPTGGLVLCGYCNTQNQFGSRNDETPFQPPATSTPIDENERVRRLRLQDGKPLIPPASILPLMDTSGGGFLASRADEAFQVYQATRYEIQQTRSPEAMERLYFLTLLANAHLNRLDDHPRRRALLETSLETLSLPRHIQVVRSELANAAAKEGDVESAEQWLRPCNPSSDDLQTDTSFRVARAYTDTVRGDFQRVLELLSNTDDGYPINDAWDPMAAMLRANALERLGYGDAAVTALRARMERGGPVDRAVLTKIRERNPGLQLCPQSFQIAVQAHAQVASVVAGRSAGGNVGTIFMVVGIAALLFGVVMFFVTGIPVLLAAMASGASLGESLLAGGTGVFVVFITTAPIGLIFTTIGYKLRKSGKEAEWLRLHGISATGTVRGHQMTGTSINDVPMVLVQVEVAHPHLQPYVATIKQLLTRELAVALQPGTTVALRIHPNQPQKVSLESV